MDLLVKSFLSYHTHTMKLQSSDFKWPYIMRKVLRICGKTVGFGIYSLAWQESLIKSHGFPYVTVGALPAEQKTDN